MMMMIIRNCLPYDEQNEEYIAKRGTEKVTQTRCRDRQREPSLERIQCVVDVIAFTAWWCSLRTKKFVTIYAK